MGVLASTRPMTASACTSIHERGGADGVGQQQLEVHKQPLQLARQGLCKRAATNS